MFYPSFRTLLNTPVLTLSDGVCAVPITCTTDTGNTLYGASVAFYGHIKTENGYAPISIAKTTLIRNAHPLTARL